MRKKLIFIGSCLLIPFAVLSQSKPVKIVFDLTSKDTLAHQATMRHVSGMAKAYPDSKFEVVIYGGALPMVVKGQSTVAKSLKELENNKNVSFKVCAITMKRYNIEPSQLLPSTQVVPDAILEIVTKQSEGWGYIKE